MLVVDLDPQGNATMGSGIDKRALELDASTKYCLKRLHRGGARAQREGGYDVVGANRELAGAEIELVELERRDGGCRTRSRRCRDDYDFVLIDCPPWLSLLTLNGLCCAHGVDRADAVRVLCLEGLYDLVNTIRQVHANLNADLQIIGLLRVMFDPRVTLQQQVSEQLKSHFGDKVFNAVIPRNVRLAEAPSYGLPGVVFDPLPRGARVHRIRAPKWSSASRRLRPLAAEARREPGAPSTLLSRIEDAGINASAPPQQRWLDGWLVRFSPGKAKRARCVNAVAQAGCRWRRSSSCAGRSTPRRGLPLMVQGHPVVTSPRGLDERLEALGMRRSRRHPRDGPPVDWTTPARRPCPPAALRAIG